jgi:C_GCAxxG_C_C family probable redox protein
VSKLDLYKRALTSASSRDAIALMKKGYACSQTVFSMFAPEYGLDRETALRISQGFVGGMWNTDDNVCGAVNGAIMAIGLRYASPKVDDVEARQKTYAAIAEFLQGFKKLHGSINCTDLIGYNLSDPQQYEEAKTKAFPTSCPVFILDAIQLVEKIV